MRTIDPNEYKSKQQMMLNVCEDCIHNKPYEQGWTKEVLEKSKICYECMDDMENRFDKGKPFEIDW